MKKYICSICGYVHDGDEPPATCPVCGVPAEKFNLMEESVAAKDCAELAVATGLKPETLAKADKIVAKYPERRSATLVTMVFPLRSRISPRGAGIMTMRRL